MDPLPPAATACPQSVEYRPEQLDLLCHVYRGWVPRIRPASPRRAWMDRSPARFAYRCLPLDIANAHGWELLSPCGFEAEWNGGDAVEDVFVRLDAGTSDEHAPVALFGQATLTFHVQGLFRTPPGFNLWVSGSPNHAKDGIAPLTGIIETDWAPFTFTMNWRFTRPRHTIRFEENEPFAFLFPIERGLIERTRPRIAPIEEAPALRQAFEEWSDSRDRFQAEMRVNPPDKPADCWQKYYYRGISASGAPGAADHQAKLHVRPFAGARTFPEAVSTQTPTRRDGADVAKLAWLMRAIERLRTLSPTDRIERRQGIGAAQFLEHHYAANRPVLLAGEVADWPAVRLWSPDYLRARIGPMPIEVQTRRADDPDFERNMAAHREIMPFADFIDRITAEAGNDLYLTAYNSAANEAALAPLHADLGSLDRLLDGAAERPHGMFWIGPTGTFTPLHHDLTNNLLLQIRGRKTVLMAAPGETPRLYNDHHVYSRVRDLTESGIVARFPQLEGLRVHRVVMEPGDALFVPLGWWHQLLATDFSVTITHTNFLWPNDAHKDYPFGG